MIKSILLAVDGSAFTDPVMKYGVWFAEKLNATLKVLSVVDVRIFEWAVAIGVEGFAPIVPSTSYQEESKKLLEQKADEVLKRAESILQKHSLHFSLEKESGNPVDVIFDKSKLVDLLILGTRGEFARWSDKMLGATLEALSRLSIKPILVVPKDYREIQKVLVAYDGSETANKALTLAAHVTSVMNLPLHILNVNSSAENAEPILKEAAEYLSVYDIPELSRSQVSGEPSAAILNAAHAVNADLVVMGSYGHSRIREAILGSTTVQVMRKSTIPILIGR